MNPPNIIRDQSIIEYVDTHIVEFHARRLERLKSIDLKSLLSRKNPYLFKSKGIASPRELIAPMLDAHLSSQEEGMFGNFLEGLAIEAARLAYGGRKSGITGIDLELEKQDVRYIVSIKPGPNWGTSSQVAKMRSDFQQATRVIHQGNPTANVIAVNGCCYGKTSKSFDKGDYWKLAGQAFWHLITGDSRFYLRIVKPLGHRARERNQTFAEDRAVLLRLLENDFAADFCDDATGRIDWNRLVAFNSSAQVAIG